MVDALSDWIQKWKIEFGLFKSQELTASRERECEMRRILHLEKRKSTGLLIVTGKWHFQVGLANRREECVRALVSDWGWRVFLV